MIKEEICRISYLPQLSAGLIDVDKGVSGVRCKE